VPKVKQDSPWGIQPVDRHQNDERSRTEAVGLPNGEECREDARKAVSRSVRNQPAEAFGFEHVINVSDCLGQSRIHSLSLVSDLEPQLFMSQSEQVA
jgi:hypothetical protein